MPNAPTDVYIRDALHQVEQDLRGAGNRPSQKKIGERVGLGVSAYSSFRNGKGGPNLPQALFIAHEFKLPLSSLLDRDAPHLSYDAQGIDCLLSGTASGARARAMRLAALGVLLGDSPEQIAQEISSMREHRGMPEERLGEARIRTLAAGGLRHRLVEILLSETAEEAQDAPLAAELCRALAKVVPGGREPTVRVVRNLSHADFEHDAMAPFLVALVAHRLVSAFIEEQVEVFRIGLAGGAHCDTFVKTIGGNSAPIPDRSGDKRLTFVPLTLEPFRSHDLPLSDAVVAHMASEARLLLGDNRVEAPTFQSFGYLGRNGVEREDPTTIALVRQHYQKLDVAIYGCGDPEPGGWLSQILNGVDVAPGSAPATDVCLNLLSERIQPIPLEGDRDFIGVSLAQIERLVRQDDKLALLLTSGRAKGLPITIVMRAGCASAVVCDQAAARAALVALAD